MIEEPEVFREIAYLYLPIISRNPRAKMLAIFENTITFKFIQGIIFDELASVFTSNYVLIVVHLYESLLE